MIGDIKIQMITIKPKVMKDLGPKKYTTMKAIIELIRASLAVLFGPNNMMVDISARIVTANKNLLL